jgi:hypothetical protein
MHMRNAISPKSPRSGSAPTLFGLQRGLALAAVALFVPAFSGASLSAAQAASASTPSTHKSAHATHKHSTAKPVAVAVVEAPAPPVPVEPPAPLWPANEKPVEARVAWDSHGLHIIAQNSSLQQILDEVATETGIKVEGLNGGDERIYGEFGPGQAHEVLSKLLLGSGYNILMAGDQGEGTPRRILLSTRSAAGATPSTSSASAYTNDEDNTDADDQPPPEQPQPAQPFIRPPFGPGNGNPNQQNVQSMMRQRQLQMQQRTANSPDQPQ